jgi:hypothetical protein
MTSLIADEGMLTILSQAKELTEIRDSSGKVIGFFAPVALENAHIYAKIAAGIDPLEIQRRKEWKEPGVSTREVFEHLKSLTKDAQMREYLQAKIDRLVERDRCATP